MERWGTGTNKKQERALSENERGVALILAMVMLVLLTLLGAWALDTSSTDLKIAGNARTTQNAFYNADAALAYYTNTAKLTDAYVTTFQTNSTATSIQTMTNLNSSGSGTTTVNIKYLGSGPLPAGSVYDADMDANGNPKFHGLYFAVLSEGTALNNADAKVESGVVQVVGN
jgi:Tfp pilus assembly protein PilX